jgi:hypothetical protein
MQPVWRRLWSRELAAGEEPAVRPGRGVLAVSGPAGGDPRAAADALVQWDFLTGAAVPLAPVWASERPLLTAVGPAGRAVWAGRSLRFRHRTVDRILGPDPSGGAVLWDAAGGAAVALMRWAECSEVHLSPDGTVWLAAGPDLFRIADPAREAEPFLRGPVSGGPIDIVGLWEEDGELWTWCAGTGRLHRFDASGRRRDGIRLDGDPGGPVIGLLMAGSVALLLTRPAAGRRGLTAWGA